MKRKHFLAVAAVACAVLAAWLAAPVQAQTIVGGTGGATMVVKDGKVTNVGSVLGEIEYQFGWGEGEIPRHWGGLVAYLGLSSDGGGEQAGIGYRHYLRAGGVFPGFGIGGFALGTDTPEITELSLFVGPELVLEVPLGDVEGDNDKVTGFVGAYSAVSGQDDTLVIRAGIRAALN